MNIEFILPSSRQEGLRQITQLEKLFGTKTWIHPMDIALLDVLHSSFVQISPSAADLLSFSLTTLYN